MQIKEPVVCGIASLGMDHTETLGELFSSNITLLNLIFTSLSVCFSSHTNNGSCIHEKIKKGWCIYGSP